MKAEDVRALSDDQLQDELLKLKKEQFNLRFQQATGQLENTARSLLYNSHCSTRRQWPPQTMAGTSYLAETICGKPGI